MREHAPAARSSSRRRPRQRGRAVTALLELRRLHVSYGGIKAVRGIDLTVGKGELVCLIGANGAGKTTTLKAICGLVHASHDSVHYDGRNIVGTPSFELV